MVAFYPSDLLDLCLGHRLLVGNDGQSLQHNVGKCRLLGLHGDADQAAVIVPLGAKLIGIFQLDNVDSPALILVFVHEIVDQLLCGGLVLLDGFRDLAKLHRLSHCKQNGLNGSF